MTRGRPMRRAAAVLATGAALLHAGAAQAVLGGDAASVHGDQMRLAGQRRQSVALQHQVHEILMADGSRIREYVSPGGVVFAVAWNTRVKPDLAALLGAHHAGYLAAAREAMLRPGMQRDVVLQRGDLVVHSMGRLNAFVGTAYVPSLVPSGVDPAAVR